MVKLLVLADDFTGALDTGVQFARQRVRTLVTDDRAVDFSAVEEGLEVLVLDLQSRHIPPEEGREVAREAAFRAQKAGVRYFYKKTDSTLRGNIGAELEGMMRGAGGGPLFFLPAYPLLGRTTRKGMQYVDGRPLADSDFARDPFTPVLSSSVSEIVAVQSGVKTVCMSPHELLACDAGENTVVVVDAETEGQIDEAAAALKERGGVRLMAGCAGFARVLPELLALEAAERPAFPRVERIMVVCGSLSAVSQRQVSLAGAGGVPVFALDEARLLTPDYGATEEGAAFAARLAQSLSGEGIVVLATAGKREVSATDESGESRAQVAKALADMAAQAVKSARPDALVVFGGDTLHAVAQALGNRGVYPHSELLPGVALSRMMLAQGPLWTVSKAGGFGGERALLEIAQALRAEKPGAEG